MTVSFYIAIIFFFAGFIQGLSGFGSSLVALPLLCLLIDIKTAVPLAILCSIIITTIMVIQLKQHADPRKIIPLCISSIPGVVVGSTLLKSADPGVIRVMLGALLIFYAIYSLACHPKPRHLNRLWAVAAGFSSGTIGAAFSAGGPPTIIYATLNNWSKNEIKGTLTGFFLFNSYLIAATHALTGGTSKAAFDYFLVSIPFILAGTLSGTYLCRFVPDKKFIKLILIFLIVMGIFMILGN